MKKRFINILVLSLVLVVLAGGTALADINIDGDNVEFDISPDRLTEDSLVPLDQFKDMVPMEIVEMDNGDRLIYFEGDYFIIEIGKVEVETNRGVRYLDTEPIYINGHTLVPVEFITDFLGIDIEDFGDLQPLPPVKIGNSLKARLIVGKQVYSRNQSIRVYILLENEGKHREVLQFTSGKKYDVYVKDKFDRIVQKWSDNKMFAQIMQELVLEPEESVLYELKLKFRGLSEGTYYLQGVIESKDNKVYTDETRIILK
ncbi:BsuPI-related putative proteinase inhibitor [Halothermothrix orenii]|uniref:Copper amine oxidase domain protein n=1 Tax=Halothermothrix orenii (strain H 168 / OCM 544 / DSM 9562) TaxID=373903 RepID=B8D249_HALOH|nr:BsuPI-related putative proteinase inhibitor [Halothermothrix orenii]ACL69276.1 hypothetical protein Hore_05180 [Halothermothrix orenii H 168]